MTREEYKQNFTSVNELSKIWQRWVCVLDKNDKQIDTVLHNGFIINILKYLNGIELDVTKNPYTKEAKLEDERATNPI